MAISKRALRLELRNARRAAQQASPQRASAARAAAPKASLDEAIGEMTAVFEAFGHMSAADIAAEEAAVAVQEAATQGPAAEEFGEDAVVGEAGAEQSYDEQAIGAQGVIQQVVAEDAVADKSIAEDAVAKQVVVEPSAIESTVIDPTVIEPPAIAPPAIGQPAAEPPAVEQTVAETAVTERTVPESLADVDAEAPPEWAKLYPHTNAIPQTICQALAAWELPELNETVEVETDDTNKKKAKRKRYSLAPPHSVGQCANTTNKTPLLEVIISKDPILRKEGIKIVLDDDMLDKRLAQFVKMVNDKPSTRKDGRISGRLRRLCAAIEQANHVLKSEVSTAETTSTGILRATLYSVLNDVLADPNFLKAKYRDTIGRLAYGDPATTTASIADVTGWSTSRWTNRRRPNLKKARSKVTVEHKRKRCLKDVALETMHHTFKKAWDERSKKKVYSLTIELDKKGGGLKWSALNGTEYEHLRRQISQVITQIYSNKTADGILYNTNSLRVFSRTKLYNVLKMSDFCSHTAPRVNVRDDGRVKDNEKLEPTPVLVFLSILATSWTIPVEHFPKTKFKLRGTDSASGQGAGSSATDKWADASMIELPDLREDPLDLDFLAIPETLDSALPEVMIPNPAFAPDSLANRLLDISSLTDEAPPLEQRTKGTHLPLRPSIASNNSTSARPSARSSARSSLLRFATTATPSTAPSSLRQSIAATEDSTASGIAQWPHVDFEVYDIKAAEHGAEVYNIKLNALWKPVHAPESPVGLRILGPDAPRTATSGTRQVVIDDIISYGHLYTTYGGVLRDVDCAEDDIKVVIKFVSPERYPAVPGTLNAHTFTSARDAFLRETSIYQNELSALQGTVVPRFYGSFTSAEGVFAMVLEYGGKQVCDDYLAPRWLSKEITSRLPAMYAKLHNAGVIHQDVNQRHVLQKLDPDADEPRLVLIDFEGSIVPPRDLRPGLAASEMAHVTALFGVRTT